MSRGLIDFTANLVMETQQMVSGRTSASLTDTLNQQCCRDSANPMVDIGQVGAGFRCRNERYGEPD